MGFQYQDRGVEAIRERQKQSSGGGSRIFRSDLPVLDIKDKKDFRLRILPPTWPNARHFGYEVWVNYNIGADNHQILSLSAMKNEPDPIAEERVEATRLGNVKYAGKLKPSKAVVVWVIDRDNEKAGPQLYKMPWTLDQQLAVLAENKRTGQALVLDHPEKGYDIEFVKEKTGKDATNVKYTGLRIDHQPSFLGPDEQTEDAWLDFIQQNPIPDCLVYLDYATIKKVFGGVVGTFGDDKDQQQNDRPRTRSDRESGGGDRGGYQDRGGDRGGNYRQDDRPSRNARGDQGGGYQDDNNLPPPSRQVRDDGNGGGRGGYQEPPQDTRPSRGSQNEPPQRERSRLDQEPDARAPQRGGYQQEAPPSRGQYQDPPPARGGYQEPPPPQQGRTGGSAEPEPRQRRRLD